MSILVRLFIQRKQPAVAEAQKPVKRLIIPYCHYITVCFRCHLFLLFYAVRVCERSGGNCETAVEQKLIVMI